MKAATSSLNPYAASYVPLSRRAEISEYEEGSKMRHDPIRAYQPNIYNIPSANYLQTEGKGQHVYGYYGSSSNQAYELEEKEYADEEEVDIEMSYLQMTFPGISRDSLSDVYFANNYDLDITVEMLNQLEQHSDSSEKLPETLDIGDVSEGESSFEISSTKLKGTIGEIGGSSSGSSGLVLGSN